MIYNDIINNFKLLYNKLNFNQKININIYIYNWIIINKNNYINNRNKYKYLLIKCCYNINDDIVYNYYNELNNFINYDNNIFWSKISKFNNLDEYECFILFINNILIDIKNLNYDYDLFFEKNKNIINNNLYMMTIKKIFN
jgi:hypothetical protein